MRGCRSRRRSWRPRILVADSGTASTEGYHLIDLRPCDNTSPAMQWRPRSDGSVYNPATGCCLADPDASTANSMRLIDGTCNGTASQQWTIPCTQPADGPAQALRRACPWRSR